MSIGGKEGSVGTVLDGSAAAVCATILRVIGDSSRVAKPVLEAPKGYVNAHGEVAGGSAAAVCTTILRAIGDSCRVAK